MLTALFLILYAAFLLVVVPYVYRRRHDIAPTLIGAFVLSFFAANYIGLGILFFGLDSYRASVGINDRELICWMLIYSIISFAAVFTTHRLVYEPRRWRATGPGTITAEERVITLVLAAISALVIFQYVRSVDAVALVVALQGRADDVLLARTNMSNNFGAFHWFRIAIVQLPVIIFYVVYLSLPKGKGSSKVILWTLFAAVLVTLILSAAKAGVIHLIIGLLFIQNKYVRKVSWSQLATWGGGSILLVLVLYVTFTDVQNYAVAVRVAFSRMLSGSIGTAHFYLEYFPGVEPFLHGRSLPNPGGILPWEPVSVSVKIMNWKFPQFLEQGIVGSSPSVFWAEGYANFGTIGVVLSGVYIGAFIGVFQRAFDRYGRFVFIKAVEGWFYSYILTVSTAGVTQFMKVTVLVPLVALIILPRLRW